MATIGEVYDPNRQQTLWFHAGNDQAVKTLDKVEDKITGDAYDYGDTTKAGVDDARLSRNVAEFAKTVTLSVLPKGVKNEDLKDSITVVKLGVKADEVRQKVESGAMTKQEAVADLLLFFGKEGLGSVAKTAEASLAITMLVATAKAVTFTLADQKMDEQLYHDESARLHLAEALKHELPAETYANVDSGMSTFGQTHRKTDTFATVQSAFDKALKEHPSIDKGLRDRLWHGKAAALDLGIKDQATLGKLLDPNNKERGAVAFREMWNNKTNVAFRLGVSAMIDERKGTSEKTKAMYAADVARFSEEKAMRAALEAKTPPVKG